MISILGCSSPSSEKIVLTCGLSENPDEPRFGIELTEKKMYYCIENIKNKGTYTYYVSEINPKDFEKIKKGVKLYLNKKIHLNKIYDATPYDLYYKFDNKTNRIRFYYSFLNDKQFKLINEIEGFKNRNFTKIEFHDFPKDLLNETLPEPPPIR